MTSSSEPTTLFERKLDFVFASAIDEVLELVGYFAEQARQSEGEVELGVYLKMGSRCMRCAMEMYGELLAGNRAEIEQGEKAT